MARGDDRRVPVERPIGTKDASVGYETERYVWKEPVGVVGIIVPELPVEILLNKLGRCWRWATRASKPAPDTPFNAARIARLIADQTEIPPGVVNIVSSRDHLVGEVITTSPDVDMVAFTGSTATGRRILEAASATLKPTFLELGGKSVNLLLDDADFEKSLPSAVTSCMHGGQGCTAHPGPAGLRRSRRPGPGRLRQLELRRPDRHVGPPGAPDLPQAAGPCARLHREGQGRGGTARHWRRGACAPAEGLLRRADAVRRRRQRHDHRPGGDLRPVLVIIPHDGDDDAVAIANDSPYGLSGMITSGDLERAKGVARRIRTGTLGINGGVWYGADAPFGGYKGSGVGRQCGIEGLEIFTETKTVGWPAGL